MNQQKLDNNPEFAFHYEHVHRKRSEKRTRGYLLLIFSLGILVFAIYNGVKGIPGASAALSSLLVSLGIDIVLLLWGIRSLMQGYRPVTDKEVKHQRKAERRELFHYAQGAVPWQYKPTAIAIEVIIGILFCVIGVYGIIFTLTSPTPGVSGLLGILFLVAGIFFLFNAVYRAKRSKQLAQLSNQELARRFERGEQTGEE